MTDPIYNEYNYRTLDPSPSAIDTNEYSDIYEDYMVSTPQSGESMNFEFHGSDIAVDPSSNLQNKLNSTDQNADSDDSFDSSFADLSLKTPYLPLKTPLGTPGSISSAQFSRTPATPPQPLVTTPQQQTTEKEPFPFPPEKRISSNEKHGSRVPALLGITTGLKYYKKIRKSIGNATSPHNSKANPNSLKAAMNEQHRQTDKLPASPKSTEYLSQTTSPRQLQQESTEIPPIPAPLNFNENITDDDMADDQGSKVQLSDGDPLWSPTVQYSVGDNVSNDDKGSPYSELYATPQTYHHTDQDSSDADLVEINIENNADCNEESDVDDKDDDEDDDLDEEEVQRLRMQSQAKNQGVYQQYTAPIVPLENTNDATIITNIEGQPPQIIRKGIQDFKLGKELGEGSYSTVMLATDINTGINYAIKILNKRHIIKEKKVKYVNIEKNALNRLGNRNGIIGLHYTFQDAASLYFVLDYAENGELLSLIKRHGTLNESSAKHYTVQLVDAIDYMHTNGVIHRDLKPENILIDKNMRLQVTDFGTAKLLEADETGKYPADTRATSFVGTAEYVSPELLNDKYCGKAADIWSLGCIVFQMIAGKPPFKASNEYQTFQKIQKLQYAFTAGFPIIIRDLIKRVLVLKPRERLTIKDIKEHLWFKDIDWNNDEQIWDTIPPELGPYKISAKSMKPMPELDTQYPNGSSTSIQRLKSSNNLSNSRVGSAKLINVRSVSSSSTVNNGKGSINSSSKQSKPKPTNAAAAVALYGTAGRKTSSSSVSPPVTKPIARNVPSSSSTSTQDQHAAAELILRARMNQQKDLKLQQLKERERRRKAQKQHELKMKNQALTQAQTQAQLKSKQEKELKAQNEKSEHDKLVMERVRLDLETKEREKKEQEAKEARQKELVDQELIALQKEKSNSRHSAEVKTNVDVIPGTNIPRPVLNTRVTSRQSTSSKSRNNSSFKIKRDTEISPMSAIDQKCAEFLIHPDERVLKVGAAEECRELTSTFEKKYKGMVIESPLGYKNKDTINLSSIGVEDDNSSVKLCDVDIDNELDNKNSETSASEPPTSAQKFRNFFTVKPAPILDNKFVSRRLLVTTFGRALVLKEIIAKDKVKYQLTTEIDLTNSDIKIVEVVGDRKSRNNKTGMFAIVSDKLTICLEVDRADVSQWTHSLATSRILEKERKLNKVLALQHEILAGHEESNAFTAASLATQKGSNAIYNDTLSSNEGNRENASATPPIKVRKPPPVPPTRKAPSSPAQKSHERKRSNGAGPMISAAINKAVSIASENAGVGVKSSDQKKITEQNSKFLARSRFH